MKFSYAAVGAAAFAFGTYCAVAWAADHTVDQKDKQFSAKQLKIKVGQSINFRNLDPYFHNVFSLSDAKTFDLGSFPLGQAKSVVFDKPGIVDIECAIHPAMKLVVEVSK